MGLKTEDIANSQGFTSRTWTSGPDRVTPRFYECTRIKSTYSQSKPNPGYCYAEGSKLRNVLYGGKPSEGWDSLLNKAYLDFKSNVYEQIQVGNDLLEMEQSINLVHDIVHAVRSPLTFVGNKLRRYSRNPGALISDSADAWLSFRFGVLPLLGEIHAATTSLLEPLPVKRVEGRASSNASGTRITTESSNWQVFDVKLHAKWAAEVVISNPNLFLAERSGLLNPASIAWEAVPFSFVIDWFLPVGQLIASTSDFAGVTFRNCYRTCYSSGNSTEYERQIYDDAITIHQQGCYMLRYPEAPNFKLNGIKLPGFGCGVVRALNALSLLQQQLRKFR